MRYIVLALATRRLTHLIVNDEITRPAREKLLDSEANYWIQYVFSCTRCMSIWSGLVVLLLSKTRLTRMVASVLALSEASIMVDEIIETQKPRSLME